MVEIYKYLKKEKTESLLSKYTIDELRDKIIIQNNKTLKYYVFNDKEEFKNYIYNLEEDERVYNEIILDNIQKFRIDLDYDKIINNNEEISYNDMNNFVEIIVKEFNKLLKKKKCIKDNNYPKYYIFDSSIDEKYSYHIIFDFYLANSKQCYLLAYELLDKLKNKIKKNKLPKILINTFDTSVYKSIQSFRLPFNQKHGKNNVKKCINHNDLSLFDAMINPINMKDKNIEITELYKEQKEKNLEDMNEIDVEDELIHKIIKKAKEEGYLENMELREVVANRIIFNRVNSGDCKLCGRIHEKENNIYIIVNQKSFKIYCRRNDENYVEYSIDEDDELEFNIKYNKYEYFKRLIKKSNELEIPEDEILKLFRDVDDKNKVIYKENKMRAYDFNDKRLLLIKANMKLGKTKALKNYLENNSIDNKYVIFISFRILFTLDVNKNFLDFKNYLTLKNKNKISIKEHKKIIIQIESLHKLSLDVIPDLLILDESESILGQFSSPYCKNNLRTIWEIFEFLLRTSKKVICMDANLGERTFNVFNKIYNIRDMYLHYNTYSTMANDDYVFIFNINKFIEKLSYYITNNKKVVVPVNSLKKAKLIYKYLQENFKEKNICLYSSESDDLVKKNDLSNVNKEWLKYDIIIYTPSITAGISFEEAHFDSIFGYFTNRSCDVYTLLQMLYRVRNVKEKKIYLFIDIYDTYENVPCTREDILENINYSIKYLINEMLNYKIEYNLSTMEVYNKINQDDIYFTLWKENKYIHFNSLLCYFKNLLIILKRNKCIVSYLDERNNKDNPIDINNLKSLINYEENEKILKMRNIDDVEYEELNNKIILTEEDKYSKKKYFLKNIYNLEYTDLTIELLEKYNKPEIIAICLNLNKVKNFTKTFDELYSYVLNNILYDNNIDNLSSLNILSIEEIINFKKVFNIIELLGLNVMNFELKLTNEELEENLQKNKMNIKDNIKYLNKELKYKTIDYTKEKKIIKFIKKLLNEVFGIKLIDKEKKTVNGELNWVQIDRCRLFNDTYPLTLNLKN
jgi:hypothetical protein